MFRQQTDPQTAVHSALTGTASSVQATQTPVLLELNGLEIFAKPLKKDVSQECIGLEALAQSYHLNVQLNFYGTINKTDACHQTMFVQVELISTDFHACHTVDVRMVKFGATPWFNASAQRTHSGMVEIVSHVSVVCCMVLLDATAHWVLSLTGLPAARSQPKNVLQLHTVFSMARYVTVFQALTRLKNHVSVPELLLGLISVISAPLSLTVNGMALSVSVIQIMLKS